MKKIFILSLFLGIFSLTAQAQGDLRFGIQVSPTFSWLDSDDKFVNSNGSNVGLRLGLFGEYYFQENYAFTAGLGFAFGQGGTLLYDDPGTFWTETEELPVALQGVTLPAGAELKHRIQYIEIPFGLKLRTREFGYFRGFAEPQFIFGINSKALGDLTASGGIEETDLNIQEEVNALALAWGFGIGGEYSVSTATAIIGGLYFQRIFTDVTDDNGTIDRTAQMRGIVDNDIKAVGNSLTIKLGVRF